MSVDEVTAKIGNPEVISSPSLKLSECSGDCNNISIMTEVTLANPDSSDITDSRPVPGSVALPNHTGSTGKCTQSGNIREKVRGNENHINRRNSFHHFKQQQKLTKRRSTSNYGFKHPSSGKRRRRANSESDSVLPTNFLLGGNIFDPLNLNSLLDEEVNKALNAETPKSSPLPAKNRDPVEILIPRDITDPLNLNSGIADSRFLVSAFKAGGRKRHRNRHHGGGAWAGGGATATAAVAHLDHSESGKSGEARATQTPGAPASSAQSDVPRESTAGDSHEPMGANAPVCGEEPSAPAVAQARKTDDLTSPTSGRRRRRRNSGKTDPPAAQSTPVAAKPGLGDRLCAVGAARHPQAFHTPRGGARSGPWGRQPPQHSNQQKHQQRQKFQYGNYNKYYGYRNPGASEDPRVRVLRPDWFQGKDVLDLGCNSGHLTLYIAKVLMPAHILGLDIDGDLVHAARKNIRHYLSEIQTQESRRATQQDKGPKREPGIREEALDCGGQKRKEPRDVHNGDGEPAGGSGGIPAEAAGDTVPGNPGDKGEELEEKEMELGHSQAPPADHPVSGVPFPVSLKISRGPIAAPPLTETASVHAGEFPSNVSFIKANYVLESDALLLTQRPEYDVIMCLSVTKWVHLNWGDAGLKRLFQRVYRHLRPGGLFLLEPQPWESYVRRKKLTDNITKHFHSIRLKPDQFSTYLTNEVGFSSYEFVGTPSSSIRGFQRPIYLFHK